MTLKSSCVLILIQDFVSWIESGALNKLQGRNAAAIESMISHLKLVIVFIEMCLPEVASKDSQMLTKEFFVELWSNTFKKVQDLRSKTPSNQGEQHMTNYKQPWRHKSYKNEKQPLPHPHAK